MVQLEWLCTGFDGEQAAMERCAGTESELSVAHSGFGASVCYHSSQPAFVFGEKDAPFLRLGNALLT